MSLAGLSTTERNLNFHFATVQCINDVLPQVDTKASMEAGLQRAIDVCGGFQRAKNTVILLIADLPPALIGLTDRKLNYANFSVLLVPNQTIDGRDVSGLWHNKTIERFFLRDSTASYEQDSGTTCLFSCDKFPLLEFAGIHLADNPYYFKELASAPWRDITDYQHGMPPFDRDGFGVHSDIWSTFVINGYDNTSTATVSNVMTDEWFRELTSVPSRFIPFCQFTFTPNVNPRPIAGGGSGVTTLSALTDVSISSLPLVHKTTRLSYVPTSTLWENVPVLQLHQWEYTVGYGLTSNGLFKANATPMNLVTQLKLNTASLSGYQDTDYIINALDLTRNNQLRLTTNKTGVVFDITGTTVGVGECLIDVVYNDEWGVPLALGDVCQFDAIGDFVYSASNVGTGTGLVEGRNGRLIEVKAVDVGLGLAGSTSAGQALTVSLNAYLDDLLDVDLTTPPTLNQVLQYDGSDWKASTISAGVLNNFTAVVDPTATDDSILGYSVGSQWMNVNHNQVFFCADATPSGAIWVVSTNDYNQHSVRGNFTASIIAGTHGVVIGDGAAILSGSDVVAIGHGAGVDGQGSVGVGHTVDVQADDCVAIGEFATCTVNDGTAVGKSSSSNGRGHIALGSGASTTATEKFALGFDGQNNVNVSGVFQRLPVSIDGTARQVLMRDTDLAFDDLTDVVVTSATSGNGIQYNGTNFVNIMRDNWITGLKFPTGITGVASTTQTSIHTFISDMTQVVNKVALYLTVGGVANIKCAIYTGRPDGGAGTTLLSETATVGTHTSLSEQEYTFPAPITITKGTVYSFAVSQVAGNSIGVFVATNGPIGLGRYTTTQYTVTGFPANLGAVAFAGLSTARFVACLR